MKKAAIRHLPFSILHGFTLLELLISMTLLLTIGTLVLSVLIVSVRSTAKINNIQLIRQNGSSVLTQMSRMIQFSQHFNGVSTDGVNYLTSCQLPSAGSGALLEFTSVQFTAFDNGVTTFSCSSPQETIASNSASLFDTNTYVVSSCKFTCTQPAENAPQTIGISFALGKKIVTNFLDDPAPIQFTTSVTLRNY